MGTLQSAATTVYRAFESDGVPASGPHQVSKADIVPLFGLADSLLDAIRNSIATLQGSQSAGLVVFDTLAHLNAQLGYPALTGGMVVSDTTNNGFYQKQGASGTGSWTRVGTAESLDPGIPTLADTTQSSANNYVAVGTPTSTQLRHGALYYANFGTANTGPAALQIDSLSSYPIVEADYTAVDAGRLSGRMVAMGDATFPGGGALVLVGIDRTTRKRQMRAKSFLAQTNITSPSSRYTESATTQIGSTLTAVGAYGIAYGRGYLTTVAKGDVLVAEWTVVAGYGNADGVVLGFNGTAFSADYQTIDTGAGAAHLLLCRADGAVIVQDGSGNLIEGFSGQADPGLTRWVTPGERLRVVVTPFEASVGALIAIYRNDNLMKTYISFNFNPLGKHPFVGGYCGGTAVAVSVNSFSHRSPVPGTQKTVHINLNVVPGGTGSIDSPYSSLPEALRNSEYTAASLKAVLRGSTTLARGSIGLLPRFEYFGIIGADIDPIRMYGSVAHASGNSDWTPVGGSTPDVYYKSLGTNGVPGGSGSGFQVSLIATSNFPPQSVGRQGGGRTLPDGYLFRQMADNSTPAQLQAYAPGSAYCDTTAGRLYCKGISTTTTSVAVTSVSRARSANVATIVWSGAHGRSAGDLVDLSGFGPTGGSVSSPYSDRQVVVLSAPNPTTFTYACVGPNESTTADTGGTFGYYSAADPRTMSLEELIYANVITIPDNPGADELMSQVEIRNFVAGYSYSSAINIARQSLTADRAQGVFAGGYGWQLGNCQFNFFSCTGYGNGTDNLNTVGDAAETYYDQPYLPTGRLFGFYSYGASRFGAGDGASAHPGTMLEIFGGQFIANGKGNIASGSTNAYGAYFSDAYDSNVNLNNQLRYTVSATLMGCTLENAGNQNIWLQGGSSRAADTLTLHVGGGTTVKGAASQHVLMTPTTGFPSSITIDGTLLSAGVAPPNGNVITNGCNKALVNPSYLI